MSRNVVIGIVLSVAVGVVAGVALAAGGDEGAPAPAAHKRVAVVINGGDRESFDVTDLKDGESRTYGSGDRQVVVTRKGDELEVVSQGADGTRKVLVDTAAIATVDVLGKDGEDGAKRIEVVAICQGDGDEPVAIPHGHGGEGHVVIRKVCTVGEGGGDVVELTSDVTSHDCAGHGQAAMATFRCKDDEALLTLPKAKEPASAPACPVCGKAMEKVTARQIVVRTVIAEPKAAL